MAKHLKPSCIAYFKTNRLNLDVGVNLPIMKQDSEY